MHWCGESHGLGTARAAMHPQLQACSCSPRWRSMASGRPENWQSMGKAPLQQQWDSMCCMSTGVASWQIHMCTLYSVHSGHVASGPSMSQSLPAYPPPQALLTCRFACCQSVVGRRRQRDGGSTALPAVPPERDAAPQNAKPPRHPSRGPPAVNV